MSFLRCAFDNIIPDATQAESWYVVLMERDSVYLGPEEGGCWGTRSTLISYREYPSKEVAEKIAIQIGDFAKELQAESQKNHSQHCLNQMDWLESRGLDSDFLPENDGPSEYRVTVTQNIPENYEPKRGYE